MGLYYAETYNLRYEYRLKIITHFIDVFKLPNNNSLHAY